MRNNKKKKIIKRILIALIVIIIILIAIYNFFFGKTKYITANVTITSTCTMNKEDIEEENQLRDNPNENNKALCILLIKGMTRQEFLEKYEVTELNINGENINLEDLTYRHLNNALSIRGYYQNYKEGNVINITIKEKTKDRDTKIRLYNTTKKEA